MTIIMDEDIEVHVHSQDILHPLATLHWEKVYGDSVGEVIINDDTVYAMKYDQLSCAPMTDLTSWTPLPLPCPDMDGFALTTYHSQLVLVGGRSGGKAVNEVWVSADGTNWQQSLPPMPTCRCEAVAVNTGGPEHLIVAGGHVDDEYCHSVDVLVQGEWFSLQNVPCTHNGILHNGNLYLWDYNTYTCIYHCRVESLLAACTQTGDKEIGLWKKINSFVNHPAVLFSFGPRLLSLAFPRYNSSKFICAALFPLTHDWVQVADAVDFTEFPAVYAISPKEILLSSHKGLYKVTLQAFPYDPDSQFSTSALTKLEAVGIPVMTSLQNVSAKLAAAIGAGHLSSLDDILEWWASGETSPVPPTWRSLYGVLRELDLEELGQQIEDYLSSPRSLKEQCTSVIMSALLQHRPLEPDQLHVRLPDYVPPTIKQSLTHTLNQHVARSHQHGSMLLAASSPSIRLRVLDQGDQ